MLTDEPPSDSQGVGSGPPETSPSGQAHSHGKTSETGHRIGPPFDSVRETGCDRCGQSGPWMMTVVDGVTLALCAECVDEFAAGAFDE